MMVEPRETKRKSWSATGRRRGGSAMRAFVIVVALCLAAGCSQTTSEPVALDSSVPSDPEPRPKTAPKELGLYSDEEIRKLAEFDGDEDEARLDVVPQGESYPRAKVFEALTID